MNRKSMVMLMFAVVSGLGAMYGTSQLLSKEHDKKPVETQTVLVAVRNLKAEEVIRKEMVTTITMSKENVPAGAYTAASEVQDRSIEIPILANEPIVDAKLAPKGAPPGLVSRIPKGMRAFAIEANEQTAVSGFVLPGHRVDIVQSIRAGGPGTPQAELILQSVLVLASGQTFTRPEDKSILSRTVTLAVTPEQVEVLVAARSRGPLSLSLRGLNDTEIVARATPPPPPPLPEPVPPPAVVPNPRSVALLEEARLRRQEPRKIMIVHGLQGVEVIQLPKASEPSDEVNAP